MKKLISYASLCIFIIILLSSCKSNLLIVKRHYNKGFHITTDKIKGSDLSIKNEQKNIRETEAIPIEKEQESQLDSKDLAMENSNMESPFSMIKENNITQNKSISSQKSKQMPRKQMPRKNIKNKQKFFKKFKKSLEKTNQTRKSSSDGEALSLLWIIVIILVVLWLLGYLIGGFGLGGLIHLLLLIALILLILWLLKVL